MTDLPRPIFIDTDPQETERSAVAQYEELTDKTLYPAQPERLFINAITYQETLVRLAIQYTGEQNLVNYAEGNNLDQIGALLDVTRLPASPGLTTLQFSLANSLGFDILIPQGTRAGVGDGLRFETVENKTLVAGQTSVSVTAQCTEAGEKGNNFGVGTITQIIDPVNYVTAVTP